MKQSTTDEAVFNTLNFYVPFSSEGSNVYVGRKLAGSAIYATMLISGGRDISHPFRLYKTSDEAYKSDEYKMLNALSNSYCGVLITSLSLFTETYDLKLKSGMRFAIINKDGKITDETNLFKGEELGNKIIELTYQGQSFSDKFEIKPVNVAVRQVCDVALI